MKLFDALVGSALVLGAVGAVRRQLELRRVRGGSQASTTALTRTLPGSTGLLEPLAHWHPAVPKSSVGRVAAAAWSAPLTVIAAALVASGGQRATWDPDLAAFVATDVRGIPALVLRAMGVQANAVGQMIVCTGQTPSHGLLAHEAAHVRQCERLGIGIVPVYLWASARHGYRDNPLERGARERARRALAVRGE